jgi:hypothetical protein
VLLVRVLDGRNPAPAIFHGEIFPPGSSRWGHGNATCVQYVSTAEISRILYGESLQPIVVTCGRGKWLTNDTLVSIVF